MPLVSRGQWFNPYFVYHAPVNEKTKELREKFDIDEETGYPRAYKWRNLARLGQEYKPEDPYLKFDDYDEQAYKGYKIYHYGSAVASAALIQFISSYAFGHKWYAKSYVFVTTCAIGCWMANLYREKTLQRQNQVNCIDVEYLQQHPERFGLVYRPKLREVLFENTYVR